MIRWLLIKNLVFALLVPGTVACVVPLGLRDHRTRHAGWIGFHLFVVLYEEPHLRRVFGDGYTRYCSGVGRWLTIPR